MYKIKYRRHSNADVKTIEFLSLSGDPWSIYINASTTTPVECRNNTPHAIHFCILQQHFVFVIKRYLIRYSLCILKVTWISRVVPGSGLALVSLLDVPATLREHWKGSTVRIHAITSLLYPYVFHKYNPHSAPSLHFQIYNLRYNDLYCAGGPKLNQTAFR